MAIIWKQRHKREITLQHIMVAVQEGAAAARIVRVFGTHHSRRHHGRHHFQEKPSSFRRLMKTWIALKRTRSATRASESAQSSRTISAI